MKKLQYYAEMLKTGKIHYTKSKTVVKPNDCNIYGLALELAVKDYYGLDLAISKKHSNDVVFYGKDGKRHFMEVKSNSSPIDGCIGRSGTMAYVFGVKLDKTLSQQWGYVMPLKSFMKIGLEMKHIKSGTTQGGNVKVEYKTQTVWINKDRLPWGKKAYKLEDAYKASGAQSFAEWFS